MLHLQIHNLFIQITQICNSCDLWERMYRLHTETAVTPELEELAREKGWKKLFFTNKLQLQVSVFMLYLTFKKVQMTYTHKINNASFKFFSILHQINNKEKRHHHNVRFHRYP